jgi:hypothetical protein
MHSCHSD